MSSSAATLGDLARDHRRRWILARCGDRELLWLDDEADRLGAVRRAREAGSPGAIVWSAGVPAGGPEPELRDELVAASGRGWGVVLVVPGLAPELPGRPQPAAEEPERVAAALAAAFDRAELVPQRLAEASVIAAAAGPVSGSLDDAETTAADVHAWLVVAGLPDAGSDPVALAAGTLHRTYLLWLENANAELSRANVRLAREHLSVQDTAAASVVNRIHRAEEARRRAEAAQHLAEAERDHAAALLEIEKEVAVRNHGYFEDARDKLAEPHHRIAEGIVRRARRVPGADRVGNRIARRLPERT